jgi:hypothetical protein
MFAYQDQVEQIRSLHMRRSIDGGGIAVEPLPR